MRLICPNCGAQYEVPQSVIPEAGRDVQCSSCGHTWFQSHPDAAPPTTDEGEPANLWDDDDDDASVDHPAADQPAPAPPQPAPAAPRRTAQTDPAEEEWQGFPKDPGLTNAPHPDQELRPDPEDPVSRLPDVAEDDYEEDPANDLPPPRRGLDTSVADLLREEAEREARARAAERGPGLESQPELGLDSAPAGMTASDNDAMRRSDEARQRLARLKGEGDQPSDMAQTRPASPQPPPIPQTNATAAPTAAPTSSQSASQPASPAALRTKPEDDHIAAAAAAAVAESRRGLLPDIEEINSSLRHTSDRRPARADDHDTPRSTVDPRDVATEKPRGFNRGFSVTLLIAMLLLALYIFAPALADAVPALTPVVDGYVAAVDQLRILLDAQVQKISRWLAEVAGSTG
ncbi:MAG: hypothetical protein B7X55_07510 [Rhodobacterales bacterium 34-62-10]|nr:MAG: hypothetical protein B7X55_07510 [Rhodobacterales bacterium 34-62-10]